MKKKSPNMGSFLLDAPRRVAIDILDDHLCDVDGQIPLPWWSYAYYAVHELKQEIVESDEPPLIVIECFRDRMREHSKRNSRNDDIFEYMAEVAESVIKALT